MMRSAQDQVGALSEELAGEGDMRLADNSRTE